MCLRFEICPQESLFTVSEIRLLFASSCLTWVWGETMEWGQVPPFFAGRPSQGTVPTEENIRVWGTAGSGGQGQRLPLFKRRKEWCQRGQKLVTIDKFTNFLGDHFLPRFRDRQEERHQPQLAVLFRSEAAKLTTRLPAFLYICSETEAQDFWSCPSPGTEQVP